MRMKRLTSTVNKKRYRESQKEGGGRKQSVVAVDVPSTGYLQFASLKLLDMKPRHHKTLVFKLMLDDLSCSKI